FGRPSRGPGRDLEMGVMLDVARAVIARRARRYLRQLARRSVFDQAMRRLVHPGPQSDAGLSAALAHQLVYGWANEKMSASEEFLQAIFRYASESNGPILECGSGLSTLVLGI